MESTQQTVLLTLLDALHAKGLLSNSTYSGAQNLVHSALDLPEFFWYPVCCQKEEGDHYGST